MKPKSVIFVIASFASCLLGMALVTIFHQPKVFYNAEGEPIPYHAIDSLLRSQYVIISPAGADTVNKYFDTPPIDLPEEMRLIQSVNNLKGHWKDGTLYIEFNNLKN